MRFEQGRKYFFFEKKKQKTFGPLTRLFGTEMTRLLSLSGV